MIARSIHPIPAPPADEDDNFCQDNAERVAPRTRRVTNDPAREYAQRSGEVEPLPNSIAALILCKKGWAKIERHQIKITLDGEELVFASRDSLVIAAQNGTGERVLWALNRRAPELLHLLTAQGAYIESVPRKGEAQWFDSGEASRAAYGDAQAQIQRDARQLRELHTGDTAAATRDAQDNAATTHRLIQTFPATTPGRDRHRPADEPKQAHAIVPGHRGETSFPKADALTGAMAEGDRQHAAHAGRQRSEEARAASAQRLGAALRESVFAAPVRAATPAAEDDAETLDSPLFQDPTPRTLNLEETC